MDSNALEEHQHITIYHTHHIIPKHMGGTDDHSNLVILSIDEHAEAHRVLYEKYGKIEDLWAFQLLTYNLNYHDGMELLLVKNAKDTHEKCKERKTGFFSSIQQSENGKRGGKALVASGKNHFFNREKNPTFTKVTCLHCGKTFNKSWFGRHLKKIDNS